MAGKLISEMGLPTSIANIFAARNILTAKDDFRPPTARLKLFPHRLGSKLLMRMLVHRNLKEGPSLLLRTKRPPLSAVLNAIRGAGTNENVDTEEPHLDEYVVLERLKNEKDVVVALEYFKFVFETRKFRHTTRTYKMMIEKLESVRDMTGVQYLLQQMKSEGVPCSADIFVSIIRLYRELGDSELALKTFYRIQDFDVRPTAKIYNHLLDALLCENRFHMINPIYDNMKKDGLKPNVYTYNILLKALCKNNRIDAAYKLLGEMSERGCEPDSVSCTTIVSALCRQGELAEAREVMRCFRPTVPAFNALVNGLCSHYKIQEAMSLIDKMVDLGLQPNIITYTTIVDALCEMESAKLSVAIVGRLLVRGCRPNVMTFTSLMKGFFKEGNVRDAIMIWNQMLKQRCKPNTVAYNTVIYGLCLNGKLHRAISVFNKMTKSEYLPNVRTYSILLDGFAKAGNLEGALEVWNTIIASGCEPNVVAYTSMVEVLCKKSMFYKVQQIIEKMWLECPPSTITYNVFIKGLCEQSQVEWAIHVLHEMKEKGCLPNITTYNEVLYALYRDGYSVKALSLLSEMLGADLDFNVVTYNTLIYGSSCIFKVRDASSFLAKMLVTGIRPDIITYNTIIHAYCKEGDIKAANQFFGAMVADGCYPDDITYTTLIGGLCERSYLEGAMVCFLKMLTSGIMPNTTTWNVLDALLLNEFELMELLDVDLDAVKSSIAQISASVCPPYQTALQLMQERLDKEYLGGHFPTTLKGLDKALLGGIPFGALTELVGPAGIGKTQFCLKLSLLAALPTSCGGLNGHVIYVDTESKFSSRRLIEIGESCYPQIFHVKGMAKELAGRIVVLQPTTLSEFTERLQQIKLSLLQNQVRLVIIDSIAALVSSDHERHVKAPRRDALGWHVSFLKSLAELSRVPIVVTNQVRSLSTNHALSYSFQADRKSELARNRDISESHLIPALGIHWAHAVNVRLVLEAHSGQRFIKLAKSPISPPLSFPFIITSAGISLLNDDGMEVSGTEINSILNEGGVLVRAGEE